MALLDSILRGVTRHRIAELPVDFSRLPAYRAEHFPDSGPKPWLDGDDWFRKSEALPAGQGRAVPPVGGIRLPGRFLNPHRRVRPFCRVAKHPELMRWIERMLGHPAKLLQTIASHKGSQQCAHSDSIHMTTYPLGYLAAAWIAFEDIHPDSGPLEFYPGSHRLPYIFSHDLQLSVDDMKNGGYATYRARYEPFVQRLIGEHGLRPKFFEARKGDVLVWHANLLHGGSSRRNLSLTRKALVGHYFATGAFVYHDLSASSSRQQYFSGCLVR